jgi:hypothetical protein
VDATTGKRIEHDASQYPGGCPWRGDAGSEMPLHQGDSSHWMVLHGLGIAHVDWWPGIDQLVMNRLPAMGAAGANMSQRTWPPMRLGFAACFGSKPDGVPSPIEQSNRPILIPKRRFGSGALKLPVRLGFTLKPDLKRLVVVSRGARMHRPKVTIDGVDAMLRNGMRFKTIDHSLDDSKPLMLATVVGKGTRENLARAIAKQHNPVACSWHATFGWSNLPEAEAGVAPLGRVLFSRLRLQLRLRQCLLRMQLEQRARAAGEVQKVKQKQIFHACRASVRCTMAELCWFHAPSFGGNRFCNECLTKV